MNLIKKTTAWFLTFVMVLGLIPQTVFAEEIASSPLQYKVFQELNEDKTEATISLKFTETETAQLTKVTLPDGTDKMEDFDDIIYTVSKNETYDFKVTYLVDGTSNEETITVEVSELEEVVDSKSTKYIHLNSHDGDDNNDGLTEENSVRTFEKAKSLIQDGDIILLDSYIEVNTNETWELSDKPNSKLQRNTDMDMIVVNPNATLTLKNIVIDGTHYSKIDNNSHSIIKLGKLAGTEAEGSNVILKSGTILENNQNNRSIGGAIAGFSYDTITMEDGAIIRNNGTIDKTAQFGGAIHLENHGQFIMNGGLIENNHAVRGGGVCLIASSMVMNNGEIINNSANSKDSYAGHYGGGIYVANFQDWPAVEGDYSREIAGEASFTMNGGIISGNEATYSSSNGDNGSGGAIATYPAFYAKYEHAPDITITINKGTINNNKAINGGAISAYFEATDISISNANISNNEAMSQGGAIYGVFNSKINLKDTVISQNKAAVGAGVYLHSSEMTMESGEISNNVASRYGGGILIAEPEWNRKTAICNILGGSINGNIAELDKGSDGIYQNSKLNIGEKALIDKDNDVYLPSNRVIDVIKPLENITSENSVSITSVDCVVEDNQNKGTRLVNYHEEAGGIDAAKDAEIKQLYLPSGYMIEGLVIGKSNADNQLNYMTYIQKKKYPVKYEFISGTTGKNLPKEVTDLIPIDNRKYLEGTTINAIQPTSTTVSVSDGTWTFKGYDADSKIATAANADENGYIKFIGTWEFKEKDTPIDPEEPDKPNPPDIPDVPNPPVQPNPPDIPDTPDTPDTPDNPDNPNTPDTPDKPNVRDTSDKPNTPTTPNASDTDNIEDTESVKTGDITNIALWTMLLAVSGICIIGIYRKKRKTNQ